jgi:hypothetical protein
MQQTLIQIKPMNDRKHGEPNINGISRREAIILGAAGAAAISFPSITRAKTGTNNVNVPLIPFTITNNTGEDVYMYAFGGLVQGLKTKSVYISNVNGDVKAFPLNAGLASYSVKLPAKVTNANFPQLSNVRIYFSVGEPLPVTSTGPTGLPNALVGWINSPQHPEFPLLWDFVELNWPQLSDRSLLVGNVTQVQMFGLAFELVLNGFNPAKPTEPLTFTNGFASGGLRAKIIQEIKAAGAPWSNLIIENPTLGGVPLRVLQPGSAIAPPGGPAIGVPLFPKDQLFDYIHNVILPFYDKSTKNRLVAAHIVGDLEWEGYTSGGKFIFAPIKGTTTQYTFDAPPTVEVYNNTIPFTDGNSGAIAAVLNASICRTTLGFKATPGFPVPATERDLYYINPPIFEYASIIHKNAIDNNAFAFGQDEVALGNGPTNQVQDPTSMAITIRSIK